MGVWDGADGLRANITQRTLPDGDAYLLDPVDSPEFRDWRKRGRPAVSAAGVPADLTVRLDANGHSAALLLIEGERHSHHVCR